MQWVAQFAAQRLKATLILFLTMKQDYCSKKMDADELLTQLQWALTHTREMGEYTCKLKMKVQQQFDRKFVQQSLREEYQRLLDA